MADLIDSLRSPVWWFSVVIAGLMVNVLASYLTRLLDQRFTRMSTWWLNRRTAELTARADVVATLRSNSNGMTLAQVALLRHQFWAILCVVQGTGAAVIGILALVAGAPPWLWVPLTALFAVLWYGFLHQERRAQDLSGVLAELLR